VANSASKEPTGAVNYRNSAPTVLAVGLDVAKKPRAPAAQTTCRPRDWHPLFNRRPAFHLQGLEHRTTDSSSTSALMLPHGFPSQVHEYSKAMPSRSRCSRYHRRTSICRQVSHTGPPFHRRPISAPLKILSKSYGESPCAFGLGRRPQPLDWFLELGSKELNITCLRRRFASS
jgi:hypothetical protein